MEWKCFLMHFPYSLCLVRHFIINLIGDMQILSAYAYKRACSCGWKRGNVSINMVNTIKRDTLLLSHIPNDVRTHTHINDGTCGWRWIPCLGRNLIYFFLHRLSLSVLLQTVGSNMERVVAASNYIFLRVCALCSALRIAGSTDNYLKWFKHIFIGRWKFVFFSFSN